MKLSTLQAHNNRTYVQSEERAYNTPNGGHSRSYRHGRARFSDGVIRSVTLGVADTFFTIPAHARIRGRYVSGFVSVETVVDGAIGGGYVDEYVFTEIVR